LGIRPRQREIEVASAIDLSISNPESDLAQFLAEMANRIDCGEHVDVAVCCSQHPGWAEQVRALLPVLQQLSVMWSRARRPRCGKQGEKTPPPDFSS
jgi:hypothetical protein